MKKPLFISILIAAGVLVFVLSPRKIVVRPDPIAERLDLEEACRVEGKWLTEIGSGHHALAGRPQALALLQVLRSDADPSFWVMQSKDCSIRKLPLPPSTSERIVMPLELADDGKFVYDVSEQSSSEQGFGVADSGGKTSSVRLPKNANPIFPRFASQAEVAGWLTRLQNNKQRVQFGPIDALEKGASFDPGPLGKASYELIDLSNSGREALLQRGEREFLFVDSNGSLLWQLTVESSVLPGRDAVRILPDGKSYLAWETDRAHGLYGLAWKLGDRVVKLEAQEGSSFSGAAVSPDWKWIAASTTPLTPEGGLNDTITIWSFTGEVRYHRRLKPFTRSPVVFLDGGRLAYSELDGQGKERTIVLKLPAAGAP